MSFRPVHLLAVLPAIAIIGAPWIANRVTPRVLGLPFLLAWIVGWVMLTSLCMWIIGRVDQRAE